MSFSITALRQGSDGYIAFFTGPNDLAGDNDLLFTRPARQNLILGGYLGMGTPSPTSTLTLKSSIAPDLSEGFSHIKIITSITGSGAANANGALIIFRQQYDSASPTGYVRCGAISSVHTAADGSYGGGIRLWYQPNSAADMLAGLTMTHDGYVGIGTSTPAFALDVQKATGSGYVAGFYNNGADPNRWGITIIGGNTDGSGTTYYMMCKDGDGDSVGYMANIGGTFAITDPSDRRLKKNIADTKIQGLNTINKLKIREFTKINSNTFHPTGFIAQELKEVIPEAVTEDEDGILGVTQIGLVPYLAKGIQELSDKLNLKHDIDDLMDKIKTLKNYNGII